MFPNHNQIISFVGAMFVYYLLFSCISQVFSFEFSDMTLVEELVENFAFHTKAQCIYIFKSKYYSTKEQSQVIALHYRLAKRIQKHSFLLQSFTFDEFFEPKSMIKSCRVATNIVLVGNGTKDEVEKFSRYQKFDTWPWVLFMNSSLSFFENTTLHFASKVKAYNAFSGDHVKLFDVFRVSNDLPLRSIYRGQWTRQEGLVISSPSPQQKNNLQGLHFRALTTENWPMTSYTNKYSNGKFDGYLIQIWNELEVLMNFHTSISLRLTTTDPILEGLKSNIDFYVDDVTLLESRFEAVDYLIPLMKTSLEIYFKTSGYNIDWKVVLRPFAYEVWLVIFLWTVIGSFTLFLISYVIDSYAINFHDKGIFNSPTKGFFFIIQTLCLQGSTHVPKSFSIRLVFFICYILASVLLPSYSASLISSLTHKNPIKPFSNLAGMKGAGYKLLVWQNTSDDFFFTKSNDPFLLKIYSEVAIPYTSVNNGYTDTLEAICADRNLALVGNGMSIETNANQIHDCNLLKMESPISTLYGGFAVKKRLPYREAFNYNILRFWEVGILQKYKYRYLNSYRQKPATVVPVTHYDVTETFCILTLGILLSVIIMLVEIFDGRQMIANERS